MFLIDNIQVGLIIIDIIGFKYIILLLLFYLSYFLFLLFSIFFFRNFFKIHFYLLHWIISFNILLVISPEFKICIFNLLQFVFKYFNFSPIIWKPPTIFTNYPFIVYANIVIIFTSTKFVNLTDCIYFCFIWAPSIRLNTKWTLHLLNK